MWRREPRIQAREIPFPRVCPDCMHQECLDLFEAWKLLTAAEKKDEEDARMGR